MRIIYLYSSLAIMGGVERVLVDKMNYLVSHYGYEVYMITSDQGKHPIAYPLDKSIHCLDLDIRFHSQYQYKGWWRYREGIRLSRLYHDRLKQCLDKIRPDMMICTTSQDVKGLLKFKGNIPLVVESHVNFSHSDSFLQRLRTYWNNYWISKADAVVTLTEGDAKNWRRVSKNVYVIPNIVHLNNMGRCSECSQKRAIFVGRLVEQKGLADLVKVWKLVNARYPDWQLDIYGNGEMDSMPEIKMYVHPPTSVIFEKYVESSMLLLTSVYEPFGLVMPEAMSCGLPVVAYDCPYGPADIIEDRVNGFIIKNRDVNLFASRVCHLIENVQLRQQMGQHGIISSQRYNADAIMPQWQTLFERLLS